MQTSSSPSQYLLLVRGNDWHHLSPAEIQTALTGFSQWIAKLTEDGTILGCNPLQDESRIVSGKGGRMVADGPFVESKEAVGGYFLIKASSFDEAVAIAQKFPVLDLGVALEVRPIAGECPTMQHARRLQAQEPVLA